MTDHIGFQASEDGPPGVLPAVDGRGLDDLVAGLQSARGHQPQRGYGGPVPDFFDRALYEAAVARRARLETGVRP